MHKESERSSATRTESEALELINDIKKQVEMGEDFPALAKEHSDCPSSNDGGSLGTFGRGAMVPEFEAAAFALEVTLLASVGLASVHRSRGVTPPRFLRSATLA